MTWDIADRDDLDLAANLLSRAYWRVRIIKSRMRQSIMHTDTDNAMEALDSKDCLNGKFKNPSTGHG